MKLSEIVRYRNNLDDITPDDIESQISMAFDPVIHAIENNGLQIPHLLSKITQDRENINSSVKTFKNTLLSIKQEIDAIITSMESTYLANSYRLYQGMKENDTAEYILNRRPVLPPHVESYLQSRIQMNSNWQHAGAVIRPGLETWINHIVGCDPMYVIDTDQDLLDPVKRNFNESYLNRLRFYRIDESDQPGMLDRLPDRQFGFVLIYNFFHYKPFDVIKNYITEIDKKLAPGGCLAFTFNDCDRWGGVENAERSFMCYTPGRLIRGWCENLGLEIVNYYIIDNSLTWIETRKPGTYNSLRGGQTLAKIIEKSK